MWFGSRQMLEKLTVSDITLDSGTTVKWSPVNPFVISASVSRVSLLWRPASLLPSASQNSPNSPARRSRCRSTAGFSIHFIATRLLQLTVVSSVRVNYAASAACDECSGSSHNELVGAATVWNQRWSSYIGCRLSKELRTLYLFMHYIHIGLAPKYLSHSF